MPFIKQNVIEEAAPLVTFENAFNVIFKEYAESVKNESEKNYCTPTPVFEEHKLGTASKLDTIS